MSRRLDPDQIMQVLQSPRGDGIGETGVISILVGDIFHLNKGRLVGIARHKVEPAVVHGHFPRNIIVTS